MVRATWRTESAAAAEPHNAAVAATFHRFFFVCAAHEAAHCHLLQHVVIAIASQLIAPAHSSPVFRTHFSAPTLPHLNESIRRACGNWSHV
jgi:hypothetical protein